MITENYTIDSNKINQDIVISQFADLHYSNIFKIERLKEIKDNLLLTRPNHICVPGDIIDMTNILDSKEKSTKLLDFFEEIGRIAPTYVSLGSHDYCRLTNGKWQEEQNSFWYNEFRELETENVVLLDNRSYDEEHIRFIGYTPTFPYYYNSTGKESQEILITDFNKKIEEFDDKKLNILLCHSPICILNNEAIERIKFFRNIDVILSGHMHNGMIFGWMDKIFPKNRGLLAPNKSPYPDNARGIKRKDIDGKEVNMIISGGITKIQESAPKILHFGDNLYSPQMENIKIRSLKK